MDSDLSIHPSHLRAGSSASSSRGVTKVASNGMPVSADRGHPDFSSSSYDDASPLHFHGLAVTQTQTQVASCAEESRKGSEVSETRVCIHFTCFLCFTYHYVSRQLLTHCHRRNSWLRGGKCVMIPNFLLYPNCHGKP